MVFFLSFFFPSETLRVRCCLTVPDGVVDKMHNAADDKFSMLTYLMNGIIKAAIFTDELFIILYISWQLTAQEGSRERRNNCFIFSFLT